MNGRVNFTAYGVASVASACIASGAPYVRYILALKTRVSMKRCREIGESEREREKERETNTKRESAGKAS